MSQQDITEAEQFLNEKGITTDTFKNMPLKWITDLMESYATIKMDALEKENKVSIKMAQGYFEQWIEIKEERASLQSELELAKHCNTTLSDELTYLISEKQLLAVTVKEQDKLIEKLKESNNGKADIIDELELESTKKSGIIQGHQSEIERFKEERSEQVKEIILQYESDLYEAQQKLYLERKRIKYSIEQITTEDKNRIPEAIRQVKRILVDAELSSNAYEYFGNICSLIESDILPQNKTE